MIICYQQSALPEYQLPFTYLQTLPPEFRPHTHMHAYHEGSGSTKFSTWLERSSPWWDLGTRLRRVSPSWIFSGIFFYGVADQSPPTPEWTSFSPLVTAVLSKFKGAESPGSRRSNRCAGLFSSIRDRRGQTFLSLAGPVAH